MMDVCFRRGSLSGCYTTRWQSTLEVGRLTKRLMHTNRRFARDVRALVHRHAAGLPAFLPVGTQHQSEHAAPSRARLLMTSECQHGGPSWDPHRIARRSDHCRLFTRLALASEL